jgi:hypothetical protein
MFKNQTLHCGNTPNISEKRLEVILEVFKRNGGKIGSEQEANIILIERACENYRKTKDQVTPDWISKCILENKLLDFSFPINKREPVSKAVNLNPFLDDSKAPQPDEPPRKKHLASWSKEQKWTLNEDNKNENLIKELEKLLNRYTALGDKWRINAYRKAINAIKRHKLPILSKNDALSIDGIGNKTAEKVKLIFIN